MKQLNIVRTYGGSLNEVIQELNMKMCVCIYIQHNYMYM